MRLLIFSHSKRFENPVNTMSTSFINNDGYLGTGTTSPRVKLDVNGTISAKEARIEGSVIATKLMARSNVWADYVFDENYKLKSLNELDTYIKENKHLPEVPSTNEVIENGIDIAQMNVILLKKVEELLGEEHSQFLKRDALGMIPA